MTLFFEEEGEITLPLSCEELAKQVIDVSLDYVDCPYECEVNLTLTTDEKIRKLNQEFRGIDYPTDVLSFPMLNYEQPGNFELFSGNAQCFDPDSGELALGDIVLSKDKVISQAKEYEHSIKREYAFLIAHSMLHLCGYDHIDEEDRTIMEFHQKRILEKLNITRDTGNQ